MDFCETRHLAAKKKYENFIRTEKIGFYIFYFDIIETFQFQEYDAAVFKPLKKYVT